ncbi:MAG: hypothetical protein Q8L05_05440 [Actinomycetota bacterium]|nr:hypothetical protein [Actinomycetota bacterium]MDP2288534.1 hypothetical protein [Actinomycetota bacterium]
MRRMFWFAVGAAVGILAYRRGQRFVDESRERGIVMTIQQAAVNASAAVESARSMVEARLNSDRNHESKGA